MSIKSKLIISYLILILFSVTFLGYLIGKKTKDAVFNEVKEKNQRITELINTTTSIRNNLLADKNYSDLNSAETLLNNLGDLNVDDTQTIKVENYDLPILYAGKQRLSLDPTVIDNIKSSTGAIASIYLLNDNKLIRVSTTLIKDNKKAIGTYLSSDSDIYNKIINNEDYSGRVTFEGESYMSKFKPLLDKNKKVIGALGLGNKMLNDYLEQTLNDIKIGKTGYVYIMDSTGTELVHPKNKGQNIGELDFAKEIISNKNGTIEYTYKGIHKLAYYNYFEPWDWYIVTTANYNDLNSSSISILYTILFSGLIIFLLGTFIALFMAKSLVNPINKLKSCMEIAGRGDLTIRSDINSMDEIGILSNSFNNMMDENKRLLDDVVNYDRLKTEFIANMSHELKTPLNIIFSTAQLFSLYLNKYENSDNVDKLNKYTNSIKQNCYRLLRLVNNLIDITKLESGFMELNLKNQNIVEVIEGITLSTVDYIKSMSRTIIFDTDIEEKIMAFDEENIERILLNLISNATKFTKAGATIEVSLYDRNDYVIISVKDNGRGIPEDKLQQIFQRFKQVDPLLSRSHEGSGIGLSIVKSLVEMHDGKIDVKSKYNEGTEFIISLPVKIVSNSNNEDSKKDFTIQTNVEKIQIEFSDIYN
ncbi:Cache 3/Cache 2 fusion domain-containing protein [Clostridium gasigenes]|uniref:Cache 3/Cache 2 fusion domain-containing protein n=1 Tax=Clostridium gasigenes TaxID=94869 RepID=UPI00162838E1|nr:Cache 3/Cache 2 fusion domain-containing protein [Clostridium gasigenes]MBB6623703.1 Cache 3/Cache 2 fusion domain-containing protein [Clostridium gasigenes]MBU3088835.1 Cache 3/Cache 2 fusion domain-containing protein [Clostridium gasigenes]